MNVICCTKWGKKAPVRSVTPVAFDGDKYVTVEFEGERYTFKAGYLYQATGRHGEVPLYPYGDLKRLPEPVYD